MWVYKSYYKKVVNESIVHPSVRWNGIEFLLFFIYIMTRINTCM